MNNSCRIYLYCALWAVSLSGVKIWAQPPAVAEQAAIAPRASEIAVDDQAPAPEGAAGSSKPLVNNATINLQTTVTGNQEQPRVLYILPWQSPESPELGIDMLGSQEHGVFSHLEREELQRSLESSGALDQFDE